jgi:hypothetical protein
VPIVLTRARGRAQFQEVTQGREFFSRAREISIGTVGTPANE